MKGAEEFVVAADKFYGSLSGILETADIFVTKDGIDVVLLDINRAQAVADLIYKVAQGIKALKDEPRGKAPKEEPKRDLASRMGG